MSDVSTSASVNTQFDNSESQQSQQLCSSHLNINAMNSNYLLQPNQDCNEKSLSFEFVSQLLDDNDNLSHRHVLPNNVFVLYHKQIDNINLTYNFIQDYCTYNMTIHNTGIFNDSNTLPFNQSFTSQQSNSQINGGNNFQGYNIANRDGNDYDIHIGVCGAILLSIPHETKSVAGTLPVTDSWESIFIRLRQILERFLQKFQVERKYNPGLEEYIIAGYGRLES
ncbi:10431_t:CDS:2 [Funneliformis geosporum]|nr:10431_t:CDS:2 [Funneliformis geosporum]